MSVLKYTRRRAANFLSAYSCSAMGSQRYSSFLPLVIHMIPTNAITQGQYDTVLREELTQILQAFRKLSTKDRKTAYRPQLSIIICGKRHHAKFVFPSIAYQLYPDSASRFFPTDSSHADRNGNTRPGTVVDKGVTGV